MGLSGGTQTINRLFTYDATYRLTGESFTASGPVGLPSSTALGYTHDNVGNRLTRSSTLGTLAAQTLSFDANDRLNSDTYDAEGNTTTGHVVIGGSSVSDAYDFEDRLINHNSGQVLIHYDGDGNRVSKTVSGDTTYYLVDEQNPSGYAQVLEEVKVVSGTPVVRRAYVYGNDLISENQFISGSWQVSYYGYDGHGSVRYLMDGLGAVTDSYDYDAFGTLIAQTGTTPNLYLYCGEQYDSDLGLYYNRARYLNTDSGRFWTRDVFEGLQADPLSLHRYLYCHSDPINYIDPSGHFEGGLAGTSATSTLSEKFDAQVKKIEARVGQKALQKTACLVAKEAVIQAGTYIFIDAVAGQLYIGRSVDIAERISQHISKGKALKDALVWVFRSESAATNALRVLEQDIINAAGGIGELSNKINGIAEKFWDQMGVCR